MQALVRQDSIAR